MQKIIQLILAVFTGYLISLNFSQNLYSQESKILITRVACVDILKILNEVNQRTDYQQYLLNMEKSYRIKSTEIKNQINELQNYLSTQTNLSIAQSNEINQEIEFQYESLQNQFAGNNNSKEELISRGIYRLIKNIAEKEGYSIILEKNSAVIYSTDEVDLTDTILTIISSDSDSEDVDVENE